MDSRTAILFDNAQTIAPLSFTTIHPCNSSSSEEEKIISSVAPLSTYVRIPSENTKKSVELSELQVPASGLGIEIFGFEDKRDGVRLRDAVGESSRCSVVATASIVIVGGGFEGKVSRKFATGRVFNASRHVLRGNRATGEGRAVCHGPQPVSTQRYPHPSLMAALAT